MTLRLALATFPGNGFPDSVLERLPAPLRSQALTKREGIRRSSFIASRLLLLASGMSLLPGDDITRILSRPPGHYGLWWSLSHTQGITACLWSTTGPCGVDVEADTRRADALGIAERYFAPEEHEWLAGLPANDLVPTFLNLWTRKESCLKAMETGIAHHLPDTVFRPGEEDPVKLPADYSGPRLSCRAFKGPGWHLAAAWRGPDSLPPPCISAL